MAAFFKLRYRLAGEQRVRYFGVDPAAAAAIQQELAAWQRGERALRALRQVERQARELIREGKHRLEPFVRAAGLRFHGRTIRQPRKALSK